MRVRLRAGRRFVSVALLAVVAAVACSSGEVPADAGSDDGGGGDIGYETDVGEEADAGEDADDGDAADVADAPEARAVFIVFASEPTELDSYLLLANAAVEVAYRSPSPDPADQDTFEAQGRPYYFTAASSDLPNYLGEPLYVDADVIDVVAARTQCRGFYLHEVLTLGAAEHSWEWAAALAGFDWVWMERVVAAARLHGKRVVWSEPSYAWQTLDESADAAARFAAWGDTLIPMFATNFPTQLADSREHAQAVADRLSLALGESHQAWYFHDSGLDVTRAGSFDLAKVEGWDSGATYFQFEGTAMDLWWGSEYMLGVRDFSDFILSSAP
jgi:hypothetical protein